MITNKNILLESPLNVPLNINDTLLLNINYKEYKVDDVVQRDATYLIKTPESIFNKVIKNNCLEDEELFELPEIDLYEQLILNRNENLGEEGEEDLDKLIEGMKQTNKIIGKKIMKLNKDIFETKSRLLNENTINRDDIMFITEIDTLLEEFTNEKNKNLNL